MPCLGAGIAYGAEHSGRIVEAAKSSGDGDAVGVFLIGVPTSSTFGGDKEGQVAVSKGKVNAINSALMSKSCK